MGFIWIILLIAAGYVLYLWYARNRGRFLESPLDVLKKRYASGEISKEQYETMKNDL